MCVCVCLRACACIGRENHQYLVKTSNIQLVTIPDLLARNFLD